MPTKTIRPPNAEDVRQFSVFAENKVGRLNELILAFAGRDVHILAMCIIDTTDSAIIRLVTNYPENAEIILNERFFAHDTTPVVAVEVPGEHELKKITSALVQAEINIHYLYPFIARPNGKCGIILRV
ncbi:MAG: acetolactate synthase, partial [Puniceicoccales bacterium]|nr:acetolactate synthase [Puniceicoccales bacterium]